MPDQIAANTVVSLSYVLKDAHGAVLEQSDPDSPVVVLQGQANVIRGLDAALLNRTAGEKFAVEVSPGEGYGPRREDWTQRISKKHFSRAGKLKAGMETVYKTDQGMRRVTVIKVGAKMLDVDLNHPLAGRALYFDVEILAIRDAEPSEITHGHAHGPGGHHH